jgi:hypothetical protein
MGYPGRKVALYCKLRMYQLSNLDNVSKCIVLADAADKYTMQCQEIWVS